MTAGLQFKHKCGDKDKAMLDIIFIHGITGDPEETWTNSAGVFWPSWLAQDLSDVCVFTAGYPSSIFGKWAKPEMNLHERASNLAAHMASCGIGERPLVLVCHSLGGLLAKALFRACCETQDESWAALANNLKLVAFYATPHEGAAVAKAIKFIVPRLSSSHIATISNENGYLMDLNESYRDLAKKKGVATIAYFERFHTKPIGLVVSRSSADPGNSVPRLIPVDADHRNICKPTDNEKTEYISLCHQIRKAIDGTAEHSGSNFEPDALSMGNQNVRKSKSRSQEKKDSRNILKISEDVEKLQEKLKEFSEERPVIDLVSLLSKKAATDLDARNISSAKKSITLASETQIKQSLMNELSAYSDLMLMWGRAELLDGELESASKTVMSVGTMLRHFDTVEAARFLKDAGRTFFNHGQSYGGPALLHSVQIYKRASRYVRKKDNAQEWAGIRNYLGESYRLLGRRNFDSKYQYWLDSAIQQYRSSLSALNRNSDVYESAMINANIALAYGYKGKFEDQKAGLSSLRDSCKMFEDTLTELPVVEHDLLAAKISHYLGNGYGEIGIRSSGVNKAKYLGRSIENYETALTNVKFCNSHYRYANTLNNLSNAIIQLCAGSPSSTHSKTIHDAKCYCEEALAIRDKDRFPLEFAQTSTNLAHVYLIISRFSSERSIAYLRMAQRKCNEARQLRSPDEVPMDWAETRLLQGEISEELTKVAGGRPNEKYDDPIEIYSDVLSVMEDAKIPYYRELAEQRLKAAYFQLNG